MEDLKGIGAGSLASFDAHDADVLAALSHPDLICSKPTPGGRGQTGHSPQRERNHSWFEGFPDGRITATMEVTVGEYTVQEGTFEGTNTGTFETESRSIAATGRTLKGRYSQVSRLRNGVIISTNLYFDDVEP
jgi:ketosteroid isomerase-like protein